METGATKEQIEAAARTKYANDGWHVPWDEWPRDEEREEASWWAKAFVPPTHRIVAVDDLRKLLEGSMPLEIDSPDTPYAPEWLDLHARLCALVEGTE